MKKEEEVKEVDNIRGVAEHLMLSEKTVRRMISQGLIPVLQHCRDYRIRRIDIERLFQPATKPDERGIGANP